MKVSAPVLRTSVARDAAAIRTPMSQHQPGAGQRHRPCRITRAPVIAAVIALIALTACGDGDSTGDSTESPTLAYVVAQCREDRGGTFVFGPEKLQIRRGNRDPVTVVEIPAGTPSLPLGLCRAYGRVRAFPGSLAKDVALTRLAVTPDGTAVVFEVTDEFSRWSRNLSPEEKQIFIVGADGSGLRPVGRASRVDSGGNFQGFRFSPDGRSVVFNDRGPDHAGKDASQVVLLDIVTGARRQVTHLSPGPSGSLGMVFSPRFVDSGTIAFGTTLDADGLHADGGVFTVRTDGTNLRAVPQPVVSLGSGINPTFVITGDQPAAAIVSLDGTAVNPHAGVKDIFEVFLVDGTNLLQLTNFGRVDTSHALLSVDRQRVFFKASYNPPLPANTNPREDCQLFSIDVTGANLRQLTDFREGQASGNGCLFAFPGGAQRLGCNLSRLFQDPVTRTLAFVSDCDPLGSNPNGVQVFSVRPDGTELRQLTNLREIMPETDGTFSAELIGIFAYPGVGSASEE